MSDWNTSAGWNNGLNGGLDGAVAGFSAGGPLGAIAGGIGGALGGLFGTKKKTDWNKKAYQESIRQFNIQDDYNKNRLQYIVKDANKAGINVEAALGAGAGHYSPTVSAGGYGSDSGSSDSGVGGFMRRAADTITSMKQAKQDRAIALESASLDLEGKRLQNDILRQKLMTEFQPGIVSKGSTQSIQDLYIPFKLPNGEIVYRLNQDSVPDTDITNVSTWQTVGDDPGSISSWFREVILPRKGSWNDRYLPGYAWGRKLLQGFIR